MHGNDKYQIIDYKGIYTEVFKSIQGFTSLKKILGM